MDIQFKKRESKLLRIKLDDANELLKIYLNKGIIYFINICIRDLI